MWLLHHIIIDNIFTLFYDYLANTSQLLHALKHLNRKKINTWTEFQVSDIVYLEALAELSQYDQAEKLYEAS